MTGRLHARQAEQRTAELEHESRAQQGYKAGKGSTKSAALYGLPVPSARPQVAWVPGYCPPQVFYGSIRARVLLAQAPRVPEMYDAHP